MTKIDIFSGFLGAGKTTLIKKLIAEAYAGEKLVLIENEFGEINIDGGFLKESGIEISEMSAGCICCSLVGDFNKALREVVEQFHPDRILIEPSGVGKLSDVIVAVERTVDECPELKLNSYVTVADASKVKVYMKNFGEFYNNQIETASTIILSRTDSIPQAKLDSAVEQLRQHNATATIVTTPWDQLTGQQLVSAMEGTATVAQDLARLEEEHHHHHDHDDHCCCGHDHDHEGHHHADEVFDSIGIETTKKFTMEKLREVLEAIEDQHAYGFVPRAKGIVAGEDGQWIHFDYVPGEPDVRNGSAEVTGRICVIGTDIDEGKIRQLFQV